MGEGRWGVPDNGGESADYTETGGEGAYRKERERRQARCYRRSKEPGRILEGGKKEGTTSSPTGQHITLTIRGQSLEVIIAYARFWNYTIP